MDHGANIGDCGYWQGNRIYSDLMRTAGAFAGGDDPPRRDGYPSRVLASGAKPLAIAGQGVSLPAGTWTLSARGSGQVWLQHAQVFGDAAWRYYPFGAGKPRSVAIPGLAKDDGHPIQVKVGLSDAADPIRDVRLLAPDASPDHPFTPEFLHNIAPFKVLRFMQFMSVDSTILANWADYLRGSGRFNDANGRKTYRHAVEICNQAGKDLWFNLHYPFDDESIRSLAAAIDADLDPRLGIYVEYVNELWNSTYGQTGRLRAEWAALGDPPMGYRKILADEYVGARMDHAINTFAEALDPSRRCVRVAAVQSAWFDRWKVMTDYMRSSGRGFGAIAAAPYFPTLWASAQWDAALARYATDPPGAVADVLAGARAGMADRLVKLQQWVAYARSIGVPVICYEGGQGLAPGKKYLPLYAAANRDPGMGVLYRDYAAALEAAGVDLMVWFEDCSLSGNFGAWGLKERSSDPDTVPKYAAVLDAINGAVPAQPVGP